MFTGLSAFPLTPFRDDQVDETAYAGLITRLTEAGVDSINVLGSTGSYAYLSRAERRRVVELAVDHARGTPVIVGIGALRTSQVAALADDAQQAGASAVLLPAMSYQPLTDADVLGLYETITRDLSVPLVVYDNPGTTHFTFTDALYSQVAELPNVASIKIPGLPAHPDQATERVRQLRSLLPQHISIGISGDPLAATGMSAGCDVWYSVIGGTLPDLAKTIIIITAAGAEEPATATTSSSHLDALWDAFNAHGSLRVTAAIAEELGLVQRPSLPLPIRGLNEAARVDLTNLLTTLTLHR